MRLANHARHEEPVVQVPLSAQEVADASEAERLAAQARLVEAGRAEAAAAKAEADAAAIAKADQIYAESIKKPGSGEPAVGEKVGDKRQLPEAASPLPAAASRPSLKRGVEAAKKNKN